MECSHTRVRASSVSQPAEQNATETRQPPFRSIRSVSTQQLATNGNTAPSTGIAAGVSLPELIPKVTAKADVKPRRRTASFKSIRRAASFMRSSVCLTESEIKPQPITVQAIPKKRVSHSVSGSSAMPVQSDPILPKPVPSNKTQRERMLALAIDEGATSSSSPSGASACASARVLPPNELVSLSPRETKPRQKQYTWQDLFLSTKAASTACQPTETLAEIPNASISPWKNPIEQYMSDLKVALQDFTRLSISNSGNCNAYLLKRCLEKAIGIGYNIHPLLFSMTYKLEFYQHAFSQQEVKGLLDFLKEELKAIENPINLATDLAEYRAIVTHLNSYLNLISKTNTDTKRTKKSFLKLVRSRSVKSSFSINNPSPDAYMSPCYLNNGTVFAMRKYIAMNKAFLAGFSKVNTGLVITTQESELINKIINKNINAVSDIALLFTQKNLSNHYSNFLNKTLDGYYQSTTDIPENLKKGKIQKLIKIMLANLIDEGLDVHHFENCLKSPFHLAKDEFSKEDFELQRKNPRLAAMLTKFQRAFMESFLNDLSKLHIIPPPTQSLLAKEKAASKTSLSERTLTQGFNQILNYFAEGNLETLLATDVQVHWEKIKAELEKH